MSYKMSISWSNGEWDGIITEAEFQYIKKCIDSGTPFGLSRDGVLIYFGVREFQTIIFTKMP